MPTLRSVAAAFARIPAPVRAALWTVTSTALFAAMWACIRFAAVDIDALEIVFFRFFFGSLFMLPWLARAGVRALRTERLGLHCINGFAQVTATIGTFAAVALIPLGTVSALTFTAPLFATAGAALFLGETVGARRWSATVVGFIGAMIIVRPGFESLSLGTVLALGSSAFIATGNLTTKALSRTEPPNTIVLYATVLMTAMSLPAALLVWTPPSLPALGWTAAMGLFGTLGLLAITRAFRAADASLVLAFRYTHLVFTTLFGFALFAELPDRWTWVGAVVIVAAGSYIARREAYRAGLAKPAAESSTAAARPRRP